MENKENMKDGQGKYGPSKLTIEPSTIEKAQTTEGYYGGGLRKPIDGTYQLPTWAVFVVLIIAFFLLKKLIYIKDDKRHGL